MVRGVAPDKPTCDCLSKARKAVGGITKQKMQAENTGTVGDNIELSPSCDVLVLIILGRSAS